MKRDTQAHKWDTPPQGSDFNAISSENQESGEPDRTLRNGGFSSVISDQARDTQAICGPMADNGLEKQTGHKSAPASKSKSALSRAIADRHKRASKALGLALFQGTDHAWRLTAEIWHLRLTADERYPAAVAMLSTLTPDDMLEAVTAVLGGAGMPLPSFLEPLDEAQWWADLASPAELDAYLVAIFATLPKRKKRDFIEYAQGVTA